MASEGVAGEPPLPSLVAVHNLITAYRQRRILFSSLRASRDIFTQLLCLCCASDRSYKRIQTRRGIGLCWCDMRSGGGGESSVIGPAHFRQVYLHTLASDNKLPRSQDPGHTHALCGALATANEQQTATATRIIKRFPQRAIKSLEQFNSIYAVPCLSGAEHVAWDSGESKLVLLAASSCHGPTKLILGSVNL